MHWIVAKMKWIMLVSGAMTCTMIYAAIAPRAAVLSTFGVSLDGPIAEIVVRSWGTLVALVGAMLIYAAFNPQTRPLVLTVAGLSKLAYVGLILNYYGAESFGNQAGIPVVVDSLMVVFYVLYLIAQRRHPAAV